MQCCNIWITHHHKGVDVFCLFYTLEFCLSWEGVLLQPIQQLSVIASTSELVLGGMYVCVHQPRHQELAMWGELRKEEGQHFSLLIDLVHTLGAIFEVGLLHK